MAIFYTLASTLLLVSLDANVLVMLELGVREFIGRLKVGNVCVYITCGGLNDRG